MKRHKELYAVYMMFPLLRPDPGSSLQRSTTFTSLYSSVSESFEINPAVEISCYLSAV